MLNFLHLVFSPPDSSLLYAGSYDPMLVALSVVIAIFASYAALLVSQHVAATTTAISRRLWIAVGGLCLGLGIWAMHFVGMLAFSLPCTTSYDPGITLFSTIPGILAGTLAISIISRREFTYLRLAMGGVLLGTGIGAMHYSGMAAMHLNGLIRYDAKLFLLSITVAITLAMLALWIKFRLQSWQARWNTAVMIASAVVMGLAVSGMHYTAMAAAYFIRVNDASLVTSGIAPAFLATIVLVVTSLIVVVTITANYVGKHNIFALGRSYKLIGLLIAGWSVIAWLSADYYYGRLANDQYRQELQLAAQQSENIAGDISENIELLKGISVMVSRDEDTHRVLRRFGDKVLPSTLLYEKRKERWTLDKMFSDINASLGTAATNLGADNIYIINAAGDCISAANADKPDSFVGTNYLDRDYFRQARAGQRGHQYAVGRASKLPGLFYSYPIIENGRFLGAVVVKRNITKFSQWINPVNAFIVDANGVIVLTQDKNLEFRTMPNATVATLPAEKILLQYKQSALEPLKISAWGDRRFPSAVRIGNSSLPTVMASRSLTESGISVYVPRPLGELVRFDTERDWLFILLAATGSMLIVAASSVVLYLQESRKTTADLRIAATAFESQEGMLVTDAHNAILRVNQAFTTVTGYTAEEVIGKNPSILGSGRHDANFYAAMWESINNAGTWEGEIWNRRKNGEVYPESLAITAVKDKNGLVTNYVATINDITVMKAAAEEIKNLAFYDPLTHLPNRRLLLDRLRQALAASGRSGKEGALLFIDLDNFKTLNDTLGHDIGDLLLQQVAQRLESCVREGDSVARLGGDEFVVMLEDLSGQSLEAAEQTEAVGEKILATLRHPYQLDGNEFRSTSSIGATLFIDHKQPIENLLKQADIAMYQAKKAGRNALRFFDPQMQESINARADMENALHKALEKQQIHLYYQIQVDSLTRPLGAEALIRWLDPERGLVSPAQFIPMAEETGLILPIGQWVLDTACARIKAWQADALTRDLVLAVNVSAKQFRQVDFVAQVRAALQSHAINPLLLKLELTESLLLENIEDTIATMNALNEVGVQFSLDDFGTGYSSLQYLKRLPLDQLKIDQSFVRDLTSDRSDMAIVRTIIAMAQSLNLDVIAEGVETGEQQQALFEMGCTHYQGYRFGKPMPIEQFEALLRKQG